MSDNEYELWDRNILNREAKAMAKDIDRMYKEIEQLREALGLCSPFIPKGILPLTYNCSFCTNPYEEHADDCEYIKLIGGDAE